MSASALTFALSLFALLGEQATPRLVSLDACADQYAIALAPEWIVALSPEKESAYSFFREAAAEYDATAARAEQVLASRPTIILRSYGGGPNASQFYKGLGVTVIDIPYAATMPEAIEVLRIVGNAMGPSATKEANRLADAADRKLAMVPKLDRLDTERLTIMYMTPGGVTAGPNSFVGDLITRAGGKTYAREGYWPDLPLEGLAAEAPDIIARAFYDSEFGHPSPWSASLHPSIKTYTEESRFIDLDAAWTACPAWYSIAAVEAFAQELANAE